MSHLPSSSTSVKIEQRHAKSTENIAQYPVMGDCRNSKSIDSVSQGSTEVKSEVIPESSGVVTSATSSAASSAAPSGAAKPSRSQKNKTLLKSVIAECLANEGISSDHPRFKSLSSKLYDIGKLLLKDAISGSEGIRETMVSIIAPQASLVVQLQKRKEK